MEKISSLPINMFEDHFGLLIEQISILVQRKILKHLKSVGYEVTFNELLMLILLESNKKGLSQKDIAERLFKDKSMVTRFVNQLEAMNLIKRERNESDARSYKVVISKKGSKLVQSLDELMIPFESSFIKKIKKSDFKIFNSVLKKLLEHARSDINSF